MLWMLLACTRAPDEGAPKPSDTASPDTAADTDPTDTADTDAGEDTGGGETDTGADPDSGTDTDPPDTGPVAPDDIAGVGSWDGHERWVGLGWPTSVGDLDGDGRDDVFLQMRNLIYQTAEPPGVAVFIPGQIPAAGTVWSDAAGAQHWLGHWGEARLDVVQPAGDVDGDGFGDVWFGDSDNTDGAFDRWLLRGPPSRWGADAADPRDAADVTWEMGPGGISGSVSSDMGDVDGDGLADTVWLGRATDVDAGTYSEEYILVLKAGTATPVSGEWQDDPWLTVGNADEPRLLGDIDGDGVQEVVVRDGEGFQVVDGAGLRAGSGGLAETVPMANDSGANWVSLPEGAAVLGDRDGDGHDDLTWFEYSVGSYSGDVQLCVRDGSLASGLPTSLDSFARAEVCWTDVGSPSVSAVADVDDDGVRDLTVSRERDGHGAGCVFPSDRWPASGRVDDAWTDMVCLADSSLATTADLDGDGADELLFSNTSYTGPIDHQGRVTVLPGADIPWDAPSGWYSGR